MILSGTVPALNEWGRSLKVQENPWSTKAYTTIREKGGIIAVYRLDASGAHLLGRTTQLVQEGVCLCLMAMQNGVVLTPALSMYVFADDGQHDSAQRVYYNGLKYVGGWYESGNLWKDFLKRWRAQPAGVQIIFRDGTSRVFTDANELASELHHLPLYSR